MALYKAGLDFSNGYVRLSISSGEPDTLLASVNTPDGLPGMLDREQCITLARYLLEAAEKMRPRTEDEPAS